MKGRVRLKELKGISKLCSVLALSFLLIASFSCSKGKKGQLLIIIDGENFHFSGKTEFKTGDDGQLRPNLWVPGAIVIFKTNGEFGSEKGEAGTVYKIVKKGGEFKLKAIEKVDVALENSVLTQKYLNK